MVNKKTNSKKTGGAQAKPKSSKGGKVLCQAQLDYAVVLGVRSNDGSNILTDERKLELQKALKRLQGDIEHLRGAYPSCQRARKRIRELLDVASKVNGLMDGEGGTLSDDVTTLREGSFDIPVVTDAGATPIQRHVRVVKLANSGNAGSGYYAQLNANDLSLYTLLSTSAYRVKSVESWTIGGEKALVAVQNSVGAVGTEILGISGGNYTRIGQGFCGILTSFPMGALPLYLANETTNIIGHNVGSATGLEVVFDVILECLI